MPNYVAHELFGDQVETRLPEQLKLAVQEEPEAFRSGLYGPDPLLFVPGGAPHSKFLHNNWQVSTAPALQSMLEFGDQGEQSFATGYLSHLLLDDFCHLWIYRWMEERGLSHRCLEVGLDWLILNQAGEKRFPSPRVMDRKRISRIAADILAPVSRREYHAGLVSMGLLCSQMTQVGKLYQRKLNRAKLKLEYTEPLAELRRTLNEAVDSAVMLIKLFASGVMQPMEPALAPAY